ncbi:peptidoglycan bridge formation glycyltransferase FemA/FemB family protein [Trueperella sp. LYQ143]|uniref:peptidoglycan bridge formation glycyltransferase FemA/FemB family protein n=1 Tax=Trueperella sp. LYQ143 TaxID=3391059 RepID=UPI0039834DA8
MKLVELTEAQFEEFAQHYGRRFQTQTIPYVRARRACGAHVDVVGLVDASGQIRAASVVTYRRWRKFFRGASLPYGPLAPWNEPDVVREFFLQLRQYLRRQGNVLELIVNPLIAKYHYADIERISEEVTPEAQHFQAVMDQLGAQRETAEYYDDPAVPIRFIYSKDISGMDYEAAVASLAKGIRRRFRREGQYGIEVRFLDAAAWPIFQQLLGGTIERTGMSAYTEDMHTFYPQLMREMGPESSMIAVAFLRPQVYLEQIAQLMDELAAKREQIMARPSSAKNERLLGELDKQWDSLVGQQTEAQEVLAEHGAEIPIACSVTFIVDREVIQMLGAMDKRFFKFTRDYPIEQAILKYSCEREMDIYNTFGVSGIWDDSAPDAPVIAFKRSLRGYVEEFVGTYYLPVRPLMSRMVGGAH